MKPNGTKCTCQDMNFFEKSSSHPENLQLARYSSAYQGSFFAYMIRVEMPINLYSKT